MKNFKQIAFGLIVGALAIGFSSFTAAPSTNNNLNTYYAKIVGTSGWTWSTSAPAHETCQAAPSLQVSCTAQAASLPADNTMPSGQPIDNFVYQP
jgi:hypothetical protein